MITVDGDTSTNDTLLVMANGHAGNQTLADTSSEGYDALVAGLRDVAETLAKSIILDGEGATKFITIHVTGATHFAAAKQVAKSIARSTLVKTAIYGQDANWGRVICAAGYSGIDLISYSSISRCGWKTVSVPCIWSRTVRRSKPMKRAPAPSWQATRSCCDWIWEWDRQMQRCGPAIYRTNT